MNNTLYFDRNGGKKSLAEMVVHQFGVAKLRDWLTEE